MIDLKHPPAKPVRWIVRNRVTNASCVVEAQTHYFAVQKARVELGAEPGEIIAYQLEEDHASDR